MQIVLPGALPDAAIAQELASHIEKKAPNFLGWLQRGQAKITDAVPADTYCTPYEFWLLQLHGFQPTETERASAGLAALRAYEAGIEVDVAQPLWLAELVHVAPARDGAALIPASELEITAEESATLYEAAIEYISDSPFRAESFDATHWRIQLPSDYRPECPSPALVSITSVNDWWTQDQAGRAWRRLVNELQMLWFDHPVNRAREARGLRPVNSLWLYGGAAPSRLKPAEDVSSQTRQIVRRLQGPALVQDWGSWLHELERLDRETFALLTTQPQLILTGADRIVDLSPGRRGLISRLMGSRNDWRQWWSARN